MTSLHETAYPRLKLEPSTQELRDVYTPTAAELRFVRRHRRQDAARLALLVLLKTAQRLGYFVALSDVPPPILTHIRQCANIPSRVTKILVPYDQSGARQRILKLIRTYMGVKPFTAGGERFIQNMSDTAAETKQEIADIVNVVIEELIRHRYELPGFSTLTRAARRARNRSNNRCYRSLYQALSPTAKNEIDLLLGVPGGVPGGWQQLKREPKKPTYREVHSYLEHLKWLKAWVIQLPPIDPIPVAKWRQYVLEARALDVAELKQVKVEKRYALVIVLIHAQLRRVVDDTVDIFIRKMRGLHTKAEERLQRYHLDQTRRAERLIGQLRDVLEAYQGAATDHDRVAGITAALNDAPETVLAECREHMAYADNNYLPFMLSPYQVQRPLLLNCIELLDLRSTHSDPSLLRAIRFVLDHRHAHKDIVALVGAEDKNQPLSVQWLPEKFRKLVMTIPSATSAEETVVHRKYFELSVLTQVMHELKSGDLYVLHSADYSDYRDQLVDWETYKEQVASYGQTVNLPTEPRALVEHARTWLADTAAVTDRRFPDNAYLDLDENGPILRKHTKDAAPAALAGIDKRIREQMPANNILDILVDAEGWLNLHRQFGPVSGFDSKLDDPRKRFITTLFCYGCNLGPTQTVRSVKGLSRKQVAWLNLRHVTEDRLGKATVHVINAYNKFSLPKYWGSGKHASADGTKWNLYEQNLLSEYHVRYGGYGGIGYYHVSDMYIALFSHFIPCGVYEAIYILDGLIKNESDIQPDTLHGDTQAQSAPVFGLAYLLGIKLMPRIRNLKDLVFFRADRSVRHQHIDSLFSETINWSLIEKHLPDMLRTALSIKAGKLAPSTVLKRLGTYSRKNKLYFAFRELGRVVRTVFLLEYINDLELRKTIHAATNKSEEFNQFTKWLFFGGEGVIAENVRHEQRKIIKYNQLVANLVILYNVEAMTRVLKELQQEGHPIDQEILAGLSPYRTEHINRFGDYTLDLDRKIRPINYKLKPL